MCNVYKHQPPCQIRGAAVSKLQFGSGRAHDTTEKSLLQESRRSPRTRPRGRIAKDEIETDIFAKDKIEDGFDLTERSGRAVKVSSQVTFIYYIVLTFCMYL